MAQQFHNGGHHDGSVTISIRDSHRYAVINQPYKGKHCKTVAQMFRRNYLNMIAKTVDKHYKVSR